MENTKNIHLSSAGLKNIIINSQDKEDEFRFISGEQELKIPRIFAEFISPRVSHIHQIDPTINYLDLSTFFTKSKRNKNNFNQLLDETMKQTIEKVIQGQTIEVTKENEKNLRHFSVLLCNEELFNQIVSSEENIDELLEEIEFYNEIDNFSSFVFESSKLIDSISEKISTKDEEKLKNLPLKILYSIIKNKNFKMKDDDALIDIINEINSNQSNENEEIKTIDLYESIDFKNLSKNKLEYFLSNFDFNEMTATIWRKLCSCILDSIEEKEKNKVFKFDGNPSHRFSGIINYLRRNKQTNICDEGIISVTASSKENDHLPKYAVDFENDEFFHSDSSNDWLQYDFKDKKIQPTHYSIKTPNNHEQGDQQCPMNWCIQVSNTGDENDWKTIDTRQNVTSVSKLNQSDTFEINTHLSPNEYYRYIRFQSTGNSSGNCTNIIISSLEYFGTLIE